MIIGRFQADYLLKHRNTLLIKTYKAKFFYDQSMPLKMVHVKHEKSLYLRSNKLFQACFLISTKFSIHQFNFDFKVISSVRNKLTPWFHIHLKSKEYFIFAYLCAYFDNY